MQRSIASSRVRSVTLVASPVMMMNAALSMAIALAMVSPT